MIDHEILKKALALYGHDAQMLKTVEECSELTQAIMHHRAGRKSAASVIDEIADVTIMAEQMRIMFGCDDVDAVIAAKMRRLAGRIEEREARK